VVGVLAMLAIIGSTVVITTRYRVLEVESIEAAAYVDQLEEGIEDRVVQVIKKDLFGGDFFLLNGDEDFQLKLPFPAGSDPPLIAGDGDEPYDSPGLADPWLASTAPDLFPDGSLRFRHVTHLSGQPPAIGDNLIVRPGEASSQDGRPTADVDGDGLIDSFLEGDLVYGPDGSQWIVGYRIIDNSSMVNVNTAHRAADLRANRDYAGDLLSDITLNTPEEPAATVWPEKISVINHLQEANFGLAGPGGFLYDRYDSGAGFADNGIGFASRFSYHWRVSASANRTLLETFPVHFTTDDERRLRSRHLLMPHNAAVELPDPLTLPAFLDEDYLPGTLRWPFGWGAAFDQWWLFDVADLPEPWTDTNANNTWDAGEVYSDANGNGVYDLGETFTDAPPLNGLYDGPEAFVDQNGNGLWDAPPWPTWVYDEYFLPSDLGPNASGTFLNSMEAPVSTNVSIDWVRRPYLTTESKDRVIRPQIAGFRHSLDSPPWNEPFNDANGNRICDVAETYIDANGNGVWDMEEAFSDLDLDGAWDNPEPLTFDADGDCVFDPGDTFIDTAPFNGLWDPPEPLDDIDGDCVRDTWTNMPQPEAVRREIMRRLPLANRANPNGADTDLRPNLDDVADPFGIRQLWAAVAAAFYKGEVEPFVDAPPLNGVYDLGEFFADANGNLTRDNRMPGLLPNIDNLPPEWVEDRIRLNNGVPLPDIDPIAPDVSLDHDVNRLIAQAVLNIYDYRDSDGAVPQTTRLLASRQPVDPDDVNTAIWGLHDDALDPAESVNHVFGMEPHPFITEVTIVWDDEDGAGYSATDEGWAVEIHNPYTFALDLSNWTLELEEPLNTFTEAYTWPDPATIAGGGFIVVVFNPHPGNNTWGKELTITECVDPVVGTCAATVEQVILAPPWITPTSKFRLKIGKVTDLDLSVTPPTLTPDVLPATIAGKPAVDTFSLDSTLTTVAPANFDPGGFDIATVQRYTGPVVAGGGGPSTWQLSRDVGEYFTDTDPLVDPGTPPDFTPGTANTWLSPLSPAPPLTDVNQAIAVAPLQLAVANRSVTDAPFVPVAGIFQSFPTVGELCQVYALGPYIINDDKGTSVPSQMAGTENGTPILADRVQLAKQYERAYLNPFPFGGDPTQDRAFNVGVTDAPTIAGVPMWQEVFNYLAVFDPQLDYDARLATFGTEVDNDNSPVAGPTANSFIRDGIDFLDPLVTRLDINEVSECVELTGDGVIGSLIDLNNLDCDIEEMESTVYGRININTAPWPVLARLPYVWNDVAKSIVNYRESISDGVGGFVGLNNIPFAGRPTSMTRSGHGFRSVGELLNVGLGGGLSSQRIDFFGFDEIPVGAPFDNEVPGEGAIGTGTPGDTYGILDPTASGGFWDPGPVLSDGAPNDFEERSMLFSRISNLATVRSDYFTCYWAIVKIDNQNSRIIKRGMFNVDRSSVNNINDRPEVENRVKGPYRDPANDVAG
jgi:hypothetical protein